MKKIAIGSLTIIGVLFVIAGSLAAYVYTRNFGVDYKGRARLDYNWKYYSTACPKEEYRYDGKYFSFSYPKFENTNTLKEVTELNRGWVFDTYNLLDVQWYEKVEDNIKGELSGYCSSPDGQVTPSTGFMRWLVNSGPNVPVYIEKIKLNGGDVVIMISGRGKESGYAPGLVADSGHEFIYVAGLSPKGIVFKAEIYEPSNLSEDLYIEKMFGTHRAGYASLSPERYAESACVLDRFLKTFEIKKL